MDLARKFKHKLRFSRSRHEEPDLPSRKLKESEESRTLVAGMAHSSSSSLRSKGRASAAGPDSEVSPSTGTSVVTTVGHGLKTTLDIATAAADAFGPLKGALGGLKAILLTYEKYASNKDKILAMVKRLGSFENSDLADKAPDAAELERRGKLRRKLEKIAQDLERMLEQNTAERLANATYDEGRLAGYVEDIRDALTDYQVSLQKDLLRLAHSTMETAHHTLIHKLRRAKDAGYSAQHHQKCLRGTREQVLADIILWLENPHDRRVYWLNGIAGTGKSTISQTFAEYCFAEGLLGASFFCSRDVSDRSDIHLIFPTLSFQLASRFPEFRAHLLETMKSTPDVAHESLSLQLEELLIKPLQSTGISTTIVVDALDECKDEEPSSIILSLLAKHIDDIPNVKFFITGRPESNIRAGFRMKGLKDTTEVLVLHQVDSGTVGHDIRTYLTHRFFQVVENRSDMDVNEPWPSPGELEVAVQRCSGLFIYAFTTVEFVISSNHDPRERLRLITSIPADTSFEGRRGIDTLYTKILGEVFAKEEPSFFPHLRSIVGTIVLLFNPLSRFYLAILLGLTSSQVSPSLRSLHSLLLIPESDSEEIRIFHKSFSDYITHAGRCPDVRYYVDPSIQHAKLAMCCLKLMGSLLKRNICGLPRYSLNRDIEDLENRRSERIGAALEYACMSWAKHLVLASTEEVYLKEILLLLRKFLHQQLLVWLEVLSLSGDAHPSVYSLNDAQNWLITAGNPAPDLLDFIQDSQRFASRSFDVIQESASHIYDSALYWLPESSIVRARYQDQGASEIRLLNATEPVWGARIFSAGSGNQVLSTLFSHKGDIMACCGASNSGLSRFVGFLKLFDVTTGVCLTTLRAGKDVATGGSADGYIDSVAFSPDDSLVAVGSGDGLATVFEVRTGSLIRAFENTPQLRRVSCLQFSSDGLSIIAGADGDDSVICIWHIISGNLTRVIENEETVVSSLIVKDELGTILVGNWNGSVKTWDTATGRCLKVFNPNQIVAFAPVFSDDTSQVAFTTYKHPNPIHVYDTTTDDLLHIIPTELAASQLCFSPSGTQLAYSTADSLILWDLKERKQVFELECKFIVDIAFSPDGSHIAAALGTYNVSVWRIGADTNTTRASDSHFNQVGRALFANGGHLAVTASDDRTVKLWDVSTLLCLHTFSGHPGQIYSLAISCDATLVASGSEDQYIRVWSCQEDYSDVKVLEGPGPFITALKFSNNGKQLVSVSYEGILTLWDTISWEKIEELDLRVGGRYIRCRSSGDIDVGPYAEHVNVPIWYLTWKVPGVPKSPFWYLEDSAWVVDEVGRRILWFPADMVRFGHDWHGTKLLFGTHTGKVVLVDFKNVV